MSKAIDESFPKLIDVLSQLYDSTFEDFDYPEYGGLDNFDSSPELVDAIQIHWNVKYYPKREWIKLILEKLVDISDIETEKETS